MLQGKRKGNARAWARSQEKESMALTEEGLQLGLLSSVVGLARASGATWLLRGAIGRRTEHL